MSREICRMEIVMTDEGDHTEVNVCGSFKGDGIDICNLVENLLRALGLSRMQSVLVCRLVEEKLREKKE